MKIFKTIKAKFTREGHHPRQGGLEIFKYIGPGLLVTVGFIDPGNWASNLAAGADYGYALLWMVTLSTIMLIVLQHNVAHLGIATGLCLSEATTKPRKRFSARPCSLRSPHRWPRYWAERSHSKCFSVYRCASGRCWC